MFFLIRVYKGANSDRPNLFFYLLRSFCKDKKYIQHTLYISGIKIFIKNYYLTE